MARHPSAGEVLGDLFRRGGTALQRLADTRSTSGAMAYGVNRPGQGYADPSKPLSQSDLRQSFGAVGTRIVAGIIEDAAAPPELTGDRALFTYERMWLSDGQCSALMNVYLLPLLQATYSIQAASDDPDDVAIAQETSDNLLHGMQGMTFHRFMRQLYLFRALYGHYVGEKCWTVDAQGKIRLKKLAPRLPKTIYRWFPNADDDLDRIMQRVWVMDPDGITGAYEFPIIPAQKLLVSTRNQIGNDYRGIGLFRPCFKHWYYKDQLYAIDGVAAAKNAMGVPVFNEPATQGNTLTPLQQSNRNLAAASLAAYQVNERAYFLVPGGWSFDLKAVSGQVRQILPSIEHHDLLMSRSFLAQFINLDSGGTLIAARDSSSFFIQALSSEAQEAADDIDPVIREMEEYNHPRDRYSTIQMQDMDQRDVQDYLRGIAGLFTAGALTNNVETENALREQIDLPDLPAAATPSGGGAPSVDSDSQGAASGESAEDAAERKKAAGITQDDSADVGGDTSPSELRRWEDLHRRAAAGEPVSAAEFAEQEERLYRARRHRAEERDERPRIVTLAQLQANALVTRAARRLQNRSARGLVTIPRANGEIVELRRFGARWETYGRKASMWAGFGDGTMRRPVEYLTRDADGSEWACLARPVTVGGKSVPNPNRSGYGSPPDDADEMLARGYTHVLWRLGDGGASGKHCPQCVYMARQGLMRIQDLRIGPGTDGTFCQDACTCTLEYRRAVTAKVGTPAQGTTKRNARELPRIDLAAGITLAGNEDALLDYWSDKICEEGGFYDCTSALAGKVDDENAVCGWIKAQVC